MPPASRPEREAERPVQAGTPSGPGEGRPAIRAPEWTVQVGVFRSARQAEHTRRLLAEGGFEAEVVTTTAADAETWHRVRVGGFSARGEALETAARLRSERALPTFVTTK
jgi:cell division protein FtsN